MQGRRVCGGGWRFEAEAFEGVVVYWLDGSGFFVLLSGWYGRELRSGAVIIGIEPFYSYGFL